MSHNHHNEDEAFLIDLRLGGVERMALANAPGWQRWRDAHPRNSRGDILGYF